MRLDQDALSHSPVDVPRARVGVPTSASAPACSLEPAWERRARKIAPDWRVVVARDGGAEQVYLLHRVFLGSGAHDASSGSALFRRIFRCGVPAAAATAATPLEPPPMVCTAFRTLPPPC